MLKPHYFGMRGEEGVPGKEDKVHEGTELHCPVMASALGVLTYTQAEVESQDDQVGGVLGLLFGGCVSGGHDGVENAGGVDFSCLVGKSSFP